MRRPSLVSQMSQTNYKIDNTFHMFFRIYVANTDPDSLENLFCICICLFFFVVGCLGHAVSEGVRLPGILGSDSLDMQFWIIWIILVVQGGLPVLSKKSVVHVSRRIPRRIFGIFCGMVLELSWTVAGFAWIVVVMWHDVTCFSCVVVRPLLHGRWVPHGLTNSNFHHLDDVELLRVDGG